MEQNTERKRDGRRRAGTEKEKIKEKEDSKNTQ